MDEYTLDVIIDGHEEKIKTYTSSIENAVDAMVSLASVVKILAITRTKDNKKWKFDSGELAYLRKMRWFIDSESAIQDSLVEKELHD